MENVLYTIGYATKDLDTFISLLKQHKINCLIDVRTSPFSKTFPMYDKPQLKEILNSHGIIYAHFGAGFGARRSEDEVYSLTYSLKGERKEQVDFNKVYDNQNFKLSVEKVFKALDKGYKVCFMCSEKYPVDCHRFWMVSYYFATLEKPFEIVNIISEHETQTFNEVLNEIDIVKYKSKFYKENSELESISFFPIQFPKWVEYWDDLFLNIKDMRELKHKYANIEIGYTKGADVDD